MTPPGYEWPENTDDCFLCGAELDEADLVYVPGWGTMCPDCAEEDE